MVASSCASLVTSHATPRAASPCPRERRGRARRRRSVQVGERHPRALARELLGDLPADAAGGAR